MTAAAPVAALAERGLAFRRFTIAHDSPHPLADWDWNQRDLAHVPFVHGGFRFTPVEVEDERAIGLSDQQILGLRWPLLVAFTHPTPRSRTYQTVLGPLVVVIEAELVPLASGGTHVVTRYALGARRWLAPLLSIAERFLRRNYARLTGEDEPLRTRRAELRGWGYTFGADGGASYRASLDLGRDHVIAPEGLAASASREWPLGRSDHLGLRVVREAARLAVFPRPSRASTQANLARAPPRPSTTSPSTARRSTYSPPPAREPARAAWRGASGACYRR